MKKILCLLMSLIMIISCVCAVDFIASADDNRYGVDISEHNGNFDIAARKEKGESFIMIRLGYYNHLDKYFMDNVKKAAEADMNFGVYLYSYAYNSDEAKIEADFTIKTLESLPTEYLEHMTIPVAYDLEEPKMAEKCSKAQITKQMTIYCEAIRNAGYTPMVYSNTDWFTNYIDIKTAVDNNYKLWYAWWYPNNNVPTDTQPEIGKTGYYADMWQYAVTNEVVGELDKNVMYSSMGCETHSYQNKVTAPSCTNGYTTHICTECGFSNRDTYTPPTKKHNYKDKLTAAAIGKNGKITPTCSVCKTTKTATTIYAPKTLTLSTTSYTYNGKAKTPSVTVKDSKGKTLVKNTDYTVTYASGRTKIGKYKVTVTFKGNYSGKKDLYFTINPKISLSTTAYTYNGKAKKPTVTVKDANGKKLSTSNYTVSYASGRKNVGKYKVTIKFKNGHSGTYTKYFTIKPAKTSLSSLTAAKKAITVKWKKKTTQTTGYQIQYSTSSSFKSAKTVTISKNSTTSKKLTGLSAKKKYYVRVRTYKTVSGTKYYSAWSSAKSIKTK